MCYHKIKNFGNTLKDQFSFWRMESIENYFENSQVDQILVLKFPICVTIH